MNYLSSWLLASLLILCSLGINAADVPADVEGANKFDQLSCIDQAIQNCINDSCLNSDNIDCEDNCGKLAQQKCQEQINE